jgi:hypothetical protein
LLPNISLEMSFSGDPENPFERGRIPADELNNSFEEPEHPAAAPRPVWPLGERLGRAWPLRAVGWLFVVVVLLFQGSCVYGFITGPHLVYPPCGDEGSLDCLEVDPQVADAYTDETACLDNTREVCLVPLGGVSRETVELVAAHFREDCGLTVRILPPLAIDTSLLDAKRRQVEAGALADFVDERYFGKRNLNDVLIGIMTADPYWSGKPNWRFAFGVWQRPDDGSAGENLRGVVSNFRMQGGGFSFLGGSKDSRLLKMTTRMVGGMYYALPDSDEPHSAMYGNILSTHDLDRMSDDLDLSVASDP